MNENWTLLMKIKLIKRQLYFARPYSKLSLALIGVQWLLTNRRWAADWPAATTVRCNQIGTHKKLSLLVRLSSRPCPFRGVLSSLKLDILPHHIYFKFLIFFSKISVSFHFSPFDNLPNSLNIKGKMILVTISLFSMLWYFPQPWYSFPLFTNWYSSPTNLIRNFTHPCNTYMSIFLFCKNYNLFIIWLKVHDL